MRIFKIVLFALTFTLVITGTASVYAAETPPAPQLVSPLNGTVVTIDSVSLEWSAVPHDRGYYWVNYVRPADIDGSWSAVPNPRVQGTQYTLSKEYLRDTMVYNTIWPSDTFYWRVQAEVDVEYYFPESWSPQSDTGVFNVLKWPAAWVDNTYWECFTFDDSLESIDNQAYLELLSWGSPDPGWWEPAGEGRVPITNSPTVHLSWSDRSTDKQQQNVTFADSYRVQLDTSSSFDDPIVDTIALNIFYVSPELSPGVYYWRVRSERNDGLVTEWNSARKFIIAETVPDSTSPPSDSTGSTDTVASDEDVNYAEITGLEYPSSVGPGETFRLDIAFDYWFDSVVVFNPVIYDSGSEELVIEDYFEDVSGIGSDTVFFEMTAPDDLGDYELTVVLYFELDGEYYYDDAGVDYVDLTVSSGSSPTVSTDEPDSGIPGFPFMAVVLGLIFFSLWGRIYPKTGSTSFS